MNKRTLHISRARGKHQVDRIYCRQPNIGRAVGPPGTTISNLMPIRECRLWNESDRNLPVLQMQDGLPLSKTTLTILLRQILPHAARLFCFCLRVASSRIDASTSSTVINCALARSCAAATEGRRVPPYTFDTCESVRPVRRCSSERLRCRLRGLPAIPDRIAPALSGCQIGGAPVLWSECGGLMAEHRPEFPGNLADDSEPDRRWFPQTPSSWQTTHSTIGIAALSSRDLVQETQRRPTFRAPGYGLSYLSAYLAAYLCYLPSKSAIECCRRTQFEFAGVPVGIPPDLTYNWPIVNVGEFISQFDGQVDRCGYMYSRGDTWGSGRRGGRAARRLQRSGSGGADPAIGDAAQRRAGDTRSRIPGFPGTTERTNR